MGLLTKLRIALLLIVMLPRFVFADTPPPPQWGSGVPESSSAVGACALYRDRSAVLAFGESTTFEVLVGDQPWIKRCRLWVNGYSPSTVAVTASCLFEGVIGGYKNGHGYYPFSTPGLGSVGGGVACVCPALQPTYDSSFGVCHGVAAAANLSLLVSSPSSKELRPAATGGNSTAELVAKVVEGTTPKAGVAVQFTTDVTANSGGHEHDDPVRPKGVLSKLSGITDVNGEVRMSFTAIEVAGIHTVKAICSTCSNTEATQEIKVKVPDLIPISPETPRNADGSFMYALTSVDFTHAGTGRYHMNQYYLTERSLINLTQLISEFANAGWGTVALNDASLFWGGLYDIAGNWGPSHSGHRDGREIDISFTRAQNPVPRVKQKDVYKKFCETNGVNVPFSILHHFVLLPHFHVYLEKQKACNRTER